MNIICARGWETKRQGRITLDTVEDFGPLRSVAYEHNGENVALEAGFAYIALFGDRDAVGEETFAGEPLKLTSEDIDDLLDVLIMHKFGLDGENIRRKLSRMMARRIDGCPF